MTKYRSCQHVLLHHNNALLTDVEWLGGYSGHLWFLERSSIHSMETGFLWVKEWNSPFRSLQDVWTSRLVKDLFSPVIGQVGDMALVSFFCSSYQSLVGYVVNIMLVALYKTFSWDPGHFSGMWFLYAHIWMVTSAVEIVYCADTLVWFVRSEWST